MLYILLAVNAVSAQEMGPVKPADLPKDMKAISTEPDRVEEDFKAHGLSLSEDGLVDLLENGFPLKDKMPERPMEKSQLVIDAMTRLTKMKSQKTIPVLIKIARFDRSVGCFKIVEYDVRNSSAQSRDDFRIRAYRLLQFNAVNALGLLQAKSGIDTVRTVLQQEKSAGAQIQYAITLGCMGDSSGVDYLISLIGQKNRKESAAAAIAFYYITGKDFGYTRNSPVRARNALAPQYAQWWNQYRGSFKPDADQVLERRLNPPSDLPKAPRSTRDLLKLAANYFDFNNTYGSSDAREKLRSSGSSLNSEYKRIASDPVEDIDVRMEALNWYFEANRRSAKADPLNILNDLRKDENPEVVDKANTLLQQIAEDKAPVVPNR